MTLLRDEVKTLKQQLDDLSSSTLSQSAVGWFIGLYCALTVLSYNIGGQW